jgi:hypothetical protein
MRWKVNGLVASFVADAQRDLPYLRHERQWIIKHTQSKAKAPSGRLGLTLNRGSLLFCKDWLLAGQTSAQKDPVETLRILH